MSTHILSPAISAPRHGLAEAIRTLPHTAFIFVVVAVAFSTVALANVPASWLDRSAGSAQAAQEPLPEAAVVLVPELAGDKARTRDRCLTCGVVETIRRLEPVGGLPAAFEFTVRLRDGSTRVSSSTTQNKWRSGDPIMFIGGTASSSH